MKVVKSLKKPMVIVLSLIFIFSSICIYTIHHGPSVKLPTVSSSKQLSMKEKLDDFNYMYTILKENYPFFEVNKRLNNVDWLNEKTRYIKEIQATKNDKDFYIALQNILGELNNGHARILNESDYTYNKKVLKKSGAKSKSWYIELNKAKTLSRYSLKSWNYDENDVNTSINDYGNVENVHTEILGSGKVAYISILSFKSTFIEEDIKKIQAFLLKIKNCKSLIIDIRQNGGGDSHYWSEYLVPLIISKPLMVKEYYVYRGGKFSINFMKCALGDVFNQVEPIGNINKENLKSLPPEINKDFKYYTESEDTILPKNSINFKGKIYMIVDKAVFSSAEMFATFAKHSGFATIVGEKTGGDGIGEDPLVCSLPNSGFVLNFPYVMGLTSDGGCDEELKTVPDIKVEDIEKDSNLSNDKAIEAVLNLSK